MADDPRSPFGRPRTIRAAIADAPAPEDILNDPAIRAQLEAERDYYLDPQTYADAGLAAAAGAGQGVDSALNMVGVGLPQNLRSDLDAVAGRNRGAAFIGNMAGTAIPMTGAAKVLGALGNVGKVLAGAGASTMFGMGKATSEAGKDKDYAALREQYIRDNPDPDVAPFRKAYDDARSAPRGTVTDKTIAPRAKQINEANAALDTREGTAREAYLKARGKTDAAATEFADSIMAGRAAGRGAYDDTMKKEGRLGAHDAWEKYVQPWGLPPLSTLPLYAGGFMGAAKGVRNVGAAQKAYGKAAQDIEAGAAAKAAGGSQMNAAEARINTVDPTWWAGAKKETQGIVAPATAGFVTAAAPLGYDAYNQPKENPEYRARLAQYDQLAPSDPRRQEALNRANQEKGDNPKYTAATDVGTYLKKGGFGAAESWGMSKLMRGLIESAGKPTMKDLRGDLAAYDALYPNARTAAKTQQPPQPPGPTKYTDLPAADISAIQAAHNAILRANKGVQGLKGVNPQTFSDQTRLSYANKGVPLEDISSRVAGSNAAAAPQLKGGKSPTLNNANVYDPAKGLLAGAGVAGAAAVAGSGDKAYASEPSSDLSHLREAKAARAAGFAEVKDGPEMSAAIDRVLKDPDLAWKSGPKQGFLRPKAVKSIVDEIRQTTGAHVSQYQVRKMLADQGAQFDLD
jgi:hypothetical protein